MKLFVDSEVEKRVNRLELPFNRYGLDKYGISRRYLIWFHSALAQLYRHYFRVEVIGAENIPKKNRAMIIGNHSGGLPVDGGMVISSLLHEMEPPRLAHGMVEKFAQSLPFLSQWFSRIGQLTGLPVHAVRLLEDDRVLMIFPEGARGTGKLYKYKYKLTRFGTGFMRLALKTKSPIIPAGFIGGEEALPTLFHLNRLAKLVGVPYWPVPPYVIPFPKPVKCQLRYGKPLLFEGNGNESDKVIADYVEEVRDAIVGLLAEGLEARGSDPSIAGKLPGSYAC